MIYLYHAVWCINTDIHFGSGKREKRWTVCRYNRKTHSRVSKWLGPTAVEGQCFVLRKTHISCIDNIHYMYAKPNELIFNSWIICELVANSYGSTATKNELIKWYSD